MSVIIVEVAEIDTIFWSCSTLFKVYNFSHKMLLFVIIITNGFTCILKIFSIIYFIRSISCIDTFS